MTDAATARRADSPVPPRWETADMPDQSGRVFLVTGANSGLGFLTARALAENGAHVVMTARDPEKGRAAVRRIEETAPRGSVALRRLDLADLDDVRRFAEAFRADGLSLDVLVNNAGIMMPARTVTRQGHELQFGVNHLAHFLLTALLWPTLATDGRARIVTVTSDLHRLGRMRFDDLDGNRRYGRLAAYAQSKLANVLFALELDRRLRASGAPVLSILAHPGYAATNLQRTGPSGFLVPLMWFGNRFLAQSPAYGVLNQLYAATGPGADGGQLIGPDGWQEKRGHPTLVEPSPAGRDRAAAQRLWQVSEALTGTQFLSEAG